MILCLLVDQNFAYISQGNNADCPLETVPSVKPISRTVLQVYLNIVNRDCQLEILTNLIKLLDFSLIWCTMYPEASRLCGVLSGHTAWSRESPGAVP